MLLAYVIDQIFFVSDIIYAWPCCPQARPMRQVMRFDVSPGSNFTKHSFIVIQIRSNITNVAFLSCYLGYTWLQIFCTDHGYPNLWHMQRIMAITQIHSYSLGVRKIIIINIFSFQRYIWSVVKRTPACQYSKKVLSTSRKQDTLHVVVASTSRRDMVGSWMGHETSWKYLNNWNWFRTFSHGWFDGTNCD